MHRSDREGIGTPDQSVEYRGTVHSSAPANSLNATFVGIFC